MSTSATNTSTNTNTVPKGNPEQAIAFAALILADDNLAITSEKLQTLLRAAGITEIEPIWTTLFANALKDKDIKDILTAVATSGPKAGGDTAPTLRTDDAQDDDASVDDRVDIDLDSDSDGDICGLFD